MQDPTIGEKEEIVKQWGSRGLPLRTFFFLSHSSAHGPQRAARTVRNTGRTNSCPNIHNGLIKYVGLASRSNLMGDGPQKAVALLLLGEGEETAEYTRSVGIQDGCVLMKSKT